MWIEFCLLVSAAIYLFYRWAIRCDDYFEKKGIPYHKSYRLLGAMGDMALQRKTMIEVFRDLYNGTDGKYYGAFDQQKPILVIRDRDILKQITIKDFDHFVNHRQTFPEGNLFSNSLFFMRDAKWKDMRTTLSPIFTGSKMRLMFQLINQVAENTITYVEKETEMKAEGVDLNLKDYITRFANDVIASTAFGLEVNSLKDKNNEFYLMGKKVTTFTTWMNIKFFLFNNFKWLCGLLKMELFDAKGVQYFSRLILESMKYRQEHNITRPDVINVLMEARGMIKSDQPKTQIRDWTDTDMVAQSFSFFFAGFDTTSVMMCLTAHELMESPEVQQRLYEEVQSVVQDLNGATLTYEALQGMKYMDMVVSEVLRKWPPAPMIDRLCTKDFRYEADDGDVVELKRGESIWISVAGFHYDPQYFPNPEKFDPERFSDENKGNIQPFTYMPFGVGPRNCIASRFALLESKAMLFYLVKSFRIVPSVKSTIPLKLSTKGFQMVPITGYWMKLMPRH